MSENRDTMPNISEFEKQQHHKKEEEPGVHLGGSDSNNKKKFTFSFWYFLIFLLLIFMVNNWILRSNIQNSIIPVDYDRFKAMISSGDIRRVEIGEEKYIGYSITREQAREALSRGKEALESPAATMRAYSTYIIDDSSFIPLLDEKKVEYYATEPEKPGLLSTLLSYLLPIIVLLVVWRIIFSRMGGGQGAFSFNQNKAKIVPEPDTGIRFSDVAGEDESKQELEEVVDFLKEPRKYTEMGAKIPKGVLLYGPPGTGKTLLARAVAGEAGVPFYKMSGADFVEMFVGVGAARVRDLFKQAREHSPCIIFIDEIDAIGRSRSGAAIGGNDEREQTLNQLLVEMDGFDARTGVIILAATNRPEVLDAALLRPGRFDRQVLVDKPDLEGRVRILQIHTRGMKLDGNVNLRGIAQATAGLAGADLANIANEAALMAVRRRHDAVMQEDLEEAIEKSIAGLERKSRVMNPVERRRVAFHETGHALTAYLTKGAEPVSKISIVPRGMGALGYTMQVPTEDRFLMSERELLNTIDTMLGGRAAEEVVFHEISTGASNDISRASDLVRKMIREYGMSGKFRNITLPTTESGIQGVGGSREYSESTQEYIDTETARIINDRYAIVMNHLKENEKALTLIAERLLKDEVIEGADFRALAGANVAASEA